MQSSLPIIETKALSKHFNEIEAIKSLNLNIPEHSITGFLGPNGAGKSTTIKLLLGLMQPSSGSGKIFGLDIEKDSPQIRRKVGYLAQSPRFYPNMTAREILRFTAKFFYTGPERIITQRVEEMLHLVGLENKADRAIKGFSGGERQRLGIAQAQINYPDLLILDEPAAALDPMGRQDVLRIMENLRDKTTLFYSTHILNDVQKVSDRVVILNQGELIAQGPIEGLLKSGREIVYDIILEGDTDRAYAELNSTNWISTISQGTKNGCLNWKILITEPEIAKKSLLPILISYPEITILGFSLEKQELEDVFMKVVSGENHEI